MRYYKKSLAGFFLIPVLFVAAVSLACSVSGGSTVVVTATPSAAPPQPTTLLTPTPIPTATPIPSPTSPPQQAADQADAALHNGDYLGAVSIYQSILTQPMLAVDPRLRTDASIGLGTAALREGKFDTAAQALTDFIKTYPTDQRVPRAYFMRGDAYLGLSQWTNAIADFQTYLQKQTGLLDSYAYERIGDANLALQQPDQALNSYAQAIKAGRGLVPLLALREKVATTYLNQGSTSYAIAQYDAILAVAQNADYRASIALTAANLVAQSGDKANANARYQDILSKYPTTTSGYKAMQAYLANGGSVDSYLRGQISFNAQDYGDTVAALYAYTSQTPLAQINPQAFIMLGQAYRQLGNYAAAISSFQTILENYPTSSLFGDAWLEEGRTLYQNNKIPDALAKYQAFVDTYPNLPQAAEAMWRIGYIYSQTGDTESSLATFEILGNKYKGTDWALDGLFRGGMASYNKGDFARAQRFLNLLGTTGTGELKSEGYFWLGRIYQINNQLDYARIAYTEASKADPGGYYSLRAADMIAGQGPFVPPKTIDFNFNDQPHLDEADNWMRQTFKITQTGPLSPLSATLAADSRILRGDELFALAAYDDAKGEYDSIAQENASNPLALYELATHYYNIGLYRAAIETTAKLLDGAKIDTTQAPKYIAALRYPVAYLDLVAPAAQKYNVDPLLVFSIIRQESLFEGAATSYASAQGLMQIIPDTGNWVALQLNWPNYQNSDVYRPYINVLFGVYYLHTQLDTFDNKVYAAVAAYNAGPGYVPDWLNTSNSDPDLFLQAISLDETQQYVRRVYEQYGMYARIYAGK